MCFVALIHCSIPGHPVVVGANRDEFLDRPGRPPGELRPGIWGGLDPRAGGTWLAVSRRGLIAAVTNLASDQPPYPRARSRGRLCLDAADLPDAATLPAFIHQAAAQAVYNPFNLLVADSRSAAVASWDGGELLVQALEPGLHVIGNARPDDVGDPKVARGRRLIGSPASIEEVLRLLPAVLGDHGQPPGSAGAICIHGDRHGTLSSTVLALAAAAANRARYLHAEGPPCRTEYRDYSYLLAAGTQTGP